MALASFICAHCGRVGTKRVSAINRAERTGGKLYCGFECVGAARRKPGKKDRARAYRAANRDRLIERARQRRQADPDKARAIARAYYYRKRDDSLARNREYHQKNRERVYERNRQWLKNNPDKTIVRDAKRLIAQTNDMRIADVPEDLAEAKAAQLRLARAIKELTEGKQG